MSYLTTPVSPFKMQIAHNADANKKKEMQIAHNSCRQSIRSVNQCTVCFVFIVSAALISLQPLPKNSMFNHDKDAVN